MPKVELPREKLIKYGPGKLSNAEPLAILLRTGTSGLNVFEPAIKHLAAQIIVAHNHPSGQTEPSAGDLEINKRLMEAGKLLGIELIDHIIVTAGGFYSFKENKLI